jgi:hypothetical protein
MVLEKAPCCMRWQARMIAVAVNSYVGCVGRTLRSLKLK